MNEHIKQALTKISSVPGSVAMEGVRELLEAMLAKYQADLLDAKPEQLHALQCYARQIRQLSKALADPGNNHPTL